MKDIWMYCENQDCVCEDICCQDCEQKTTCNRRCKSIRWKEKVYSSDEFLIEQLDKLAEREDNWLIAVAVEKIKDLTKAFDKACEIISHAAGCPEPGWQFLANCSEISCDTCYRNYLLQKIKNC